MSGFQKPNSNKNSKGKEKPNGGRLTEVYFASFIPPMVPEFVDEHITVLDEGGYLFEVDPAHPDAEEVRNSGQTIRDVLKECGFTGVKHVYSGRRPAHL